MTDNFSETLPFIPPKAFDELIFIKLGGSLITSKDEAYKANTALLTSLLEQIRGFLIQFPKKRVLLGHGSGSFGHVAGKKYGTRDGVFDPAGWQGYHSVWQKARELHNIVLASALNLTPPLPVISFPPSASVSATNRQVSAWNLDPIISAIENGLVPIVYGDVVSDHQLGGTILSTEDLFLALAESLKPARVLIFGKTDGVYEDFPTCKKVLPHINAKSALPGSLTGSSSIDVTGGMLEKVRLMQRLCAVSPKTQVRICPANQPDQLMNALLGKDTGTLITHN